MAINPRPVPSDDEVQELAEFLIKIAHVLAITTASEIAGVLQITWDLSEMQVGTYQTGEILRPVHGDAGVLLGRAYDVVLSVYGWHDDHHQMVILLVQDGDQIAND